MKRKIVNNTLARVFGFLAFIATGGGLLASTAMKDPSYYKTEIVLIYGSFFAISLIDHFIQLIESDHNDKNK